MKAVGIRGVMVVGLLGIALAACGGEASTESTSAPSQSTQVSSQYAAANEHLSVSAELPIGDRTILHYRYTNGDREVAVDIKSYGTEIKDLFANFTPDLVRTMKEQVAERL